MDVFQKVPTSFVKPLKVNQVVDVIIVSLLSKLMKVEKQVLIANFVKLSILSTLTSFKIILNGSGKERKI